MAERKKKNGHWGVRITVMVLVTAALGVSLAFEGKINDALGLGEKSAPPPVAGESLDLDVHFVDVGQGDACILELPDDRVMLIDAGESDKDDKLINYIDENVRRDGKKLEYFDMVMITHSDSDHCGEMADVLEKYPAKTFYRPNVAAVNGDYADPGIAAGDLYGNYREKDTVTYKKAIAAGYKSAEVTFATNANDDEQNVIAPKIGEGEPGYYSLTLYTPTVAVYPTDWNNYSPIMILEYEGKRMALSGDAEKEAEAEFVSLATAPTGRSDRFKKFTDDFYVNLIKLGHHGSRTSTSEDYLDVMTTAASCPQTFAIASCGKDNSYGHPHAETLTRLGEYGFTADRILRTDELGTIVASVKLDEKGAYALTVAGVRAGEVAVFVWRWLYIAGIVFAAVFVLVIVLPSLTRSQRKRAVKRAARQIDRKK